MTAETRYEAGVATPGRRRRRFEKSDCSHSRGTVQRFGGKSGENNRLNRFG